MKKNIIFLFATILIITSACNLKEANNQYSEKDVPNVNQNNMGNDINQRLDEIKNGRTPKVKPTESATDPNAQSQQSQAQGQAQDPDQKINLEDLASQFSHALIKTNFGDIKVELYAKESPLTVNNFLNLAKKGFYNDTKFHRVIPNFMIQGGDPNSKDDDWSNDGIGGPGYKFQDEFNDRKLAKGSLAMANSGPNTNGSQFFIVTAESTPWLDGKHTNFGQVVEGMDAVLKIEKVKVNENDHPTDDVVVKGIELMK
jgi:cyclophilin family peptidyl-prolyl cis-trans isomerase